MLLGTNGQFSVDLATFFYPLRQIEFFSYLPSALSIITYEDGTLALSFLEGGTY